MSYADKSDFERERDRLIAEIAEVSPTCSTRLSQPASRPPADGPELATELGQVLLERQSAQSEH